MTPLAVLTALSWASDLASGAFLLWTGRALCRVITVKGVRFDDPMKVIALLLVSGRYAFSFVRWGFGAHRELLTQAEIVGREIAFLWSLVTLLIAVLVIRAYKALV